MSVAILLFTLAASPGGQTWNFKTGPTPTVSVANVDGAISVQAAASDEVTVEATVTDGENSGWRVDVKQEGSEIRARACCGPCDSHSEKCRSGSVQFAVRVPPGTSLKVSGVSSNVTVDGVAGAQRINTVSGQIENRGSASTLELHSVSGDVTISPKAIAETQVRTVSGNVHVKLPPNPDAKVHLSTVSGRLNGKSSGIGSAETSFGKGTVAMNVRTVSGSVDAQPQQ